MVAKKWYVQSLSELDCVQPLQRRPYFNAFLGATPLKCAVLMSCITFLGKLEQFRCWPLFDSLRCRFSVDNVANNHRNRSKTFLGTFSEFRCRICGVNRNGASKTSLRHVEHLRAHSLPTETKVESGTSPNKIGTAVNFSNSGFLELRERCAVVRRSGATSRVLLYAQGCCAWHGPRQPWVVRVGGEDGELQPWHYIYVHSIEGRLIMSCEGVCVRRICHPSLIRTLRCGCA